MPRGRKLLRITGRARPFGGDEERIFNRACSLMIACGRQEAMFVGDVSFGELAHADVGPFHIERMILGEDDVYAEHRVEIGIAHEGRPVFHAGFEQWRRPRRRNELTVACNVATFERGEWEKAFLDIPVPGRAEAPDIKEAKC